MEGFKETEIGLIPEDWEIVNFGTIAEFKNGINFPKTAKGDIGILTIDVKNMYGNGCYVNLDNLYRVNKEFSKDYNLIDGDLLFVRSSLMQSGVGWTSLFKSNGEKVTYCGFIIRARLDSEEFSKEFLTQYFRSDIARANLVAGSGKVAITNINQGLLSSLQIPKPKLLEQTTISHILSTIQQAIEKQQQLIHSTTELKKALMHKLFTEGTKGEKLKETEIGLIPESWEVLELRNLADGFLGGGTPSTKKSDFWNGDIPWITSKWLNDKLYLNTGEKFISQTGLASSATNLIPENNLIFATRVGVGKVGINKIGLSINQDLAGAIINSSVYDLEFIAYQYQTPRIQNEIETHKRGATIKGITRENLKDSKFGIPKHFEEQKEISNILISITNKIENHTKKKTALESLFKTMLHELMTGKTRVKDVDFIKDYKLNETVNMAAEP